MRRRGACQCWQAFVDIQAFDDIARFSATLNQSRLKIGHVVLALSCSQGLTVAVQSRFVLRQSSDKTDKSVISGAHLGAHCSTHTRVVVTFKLDNIIRMRGGSSSGQTFSLKRSHKTFARFPKSRFAEFGDLTSMCRCGVNDVTKSAPIK